MRWLLAQTNAVERVPGGHVGEDYFVADFEALENFDGVDGTLAELDVDADGFRAVVDQLEQTDGAVRLAVNGAADEENVLEIFEFDGAIDAEIGAGAKRERLDDLDVDGDGAIYHGRVDAGNPTVDDAVARVDGSGLADGDILGLGFGDFDFGLEMLGIGDAGEIRARNNVLADLDGDELKNALNAGANVKGIEFAAFEVIEGALLIDFRLLRLNTGARGFLGILGAVILELGADGELLDLHTRKLLGDLGAEALGTEFRVHFVLDFGLFEFAANGCGGGFLVEKLAVDLDLETFEVGLSSLELIFGVEGFALENGVAELQDDAVWLNDGAGIQNLAIDARIGLRGDPADVLRDEGAEAMDFTEHGAAFYVVGPDGAFVDGGSGGTEMGDAVGDAGDGNDDDAGIEDAADSFGVGVGWSLNVHRDAFIHS